MFDDLVDTLQRLADVLQTARTLGGRWPAIAEAATVSVPGCDAATIAISIGGRPATAAMTATVALELDMVQYDNDDGPCLTLFRTASALRIDLYEQGEAFPHIAIAARRVGVRAVLSVPSLWGAETSRRSTFTAAPARSTKPPRPSPRYSPRRSRSPSADHPSSSPPEPFSKSPTQRRRPLPDLDGHRTAHRQPGLHPRTSRRTPPPSRHRGRTDHLADRPTHHRTTPHHTLNQRRRDGRSA